MNSWIGKCAIALVLTYFGLMKANATSTFDCTADDAAVELNIMGHLGVGAGEPMGDVVGEIQEKSAPLQSGADIIKFDEKGLTQFWSGEVDFRLRLYLLHEAMEIIIETHANSENDNSFTGTYMILTESDASSKGPNFTLQGSISCFID